MYKWTTKRFWADLVERSVSTFVQAGLAVVIAGGATTITGVDWKLAASTAALAAVIAVAKAFIVADPTDTQTGQAER